MSRRRTKALALTGAAIAAFGVGLLAQRVYWSHRNFRSLALNLETSNDPNILLAEANRLSWLFNWPKAGPLYQRAADLFSQAGDARNALYAMIGLRRSQAETMPCADISNFLAAQLQTPLVQHDPRLRLWCLVSKGMTDIEIDVPAAERDWEEAQSLAESLGENTGANRARGKLGLLAFLDGDSKKAHRFVGIALLSAMVHGDTGGQVRYLTSNR